MKELKIKAKNIVKKNLWKSIVVCFIASAIFTLGYKYNTEKKLFIMKIILLLILM